MIPRAIRAILRGPMRRLLAIPLAAALTACGSPCGDLGERICLCQPPGAARDACRRSIDEQIDSGNPRPGEDQQRFCEERLSRCLEPSKDPLMCDRLLTPEGRVACGLAYDPAGG